MSFKSLGVESVEADPDEEIPASASATLSFLIPSTLIDGSQINVFALYSYDTFSEASMSTPLAYVLLDEEEVVDCDNGVNILGCVFANISKKGGNYYYNNKYKYYYQQYYGKDALKAQENPDANKSKPLEEEQGKPEAVEEPVQEEKKD